jgi:aryl-alcohol dehydrogenase-like predicted oxidoreductase
LDPENDPNANPKETTMLTRRDCLAYTANGCAAAALLPSLAGAQSGDVIKRAIPKTGEEIPIIGLGSSATFSELAMANDLDPLKEVFQTMLDAGGTVFDTAPSYGRGSAEEVAGQIADELDLTSRIFWATKFNVAGRGGSADPVAAREQLDQSFELLRADPLDLIQVHNIADIPTQLGILKELKAEGRVRYIGTTSTSERQYEALAEWMRTEPLDFIGIDYAVDNVGAAEQLFPIARDRGIAVMVYMPFGRTRLWDRVAGHEVPAFARDFGAESWAQYFLKFAAAHPDVTTVTPATSKAHHMLDNMGAAVGRLPDAGEQQRMIEFIDALPQA